MIRFRRYRVFLIFSLIIIALLYQVSKNSRWDPAGPSPYDSPQWNSGSDRKPSYGGPEEVRLAEGNGEAPAEPQPKEPAPIKIPQLKTSNELKGEYGLPTPTETPTPAETRASGADKPSPVKGAAHATGAVVLDIPILKPGLVEDLSQAEDESAIVQKPPGALEGPAKPASTAVHWRKVPEQFPVPEESLIMLPTGKPKPIPTVQYRFGDESETAKVKRESRLAKVKNEALRAWRGYKKFAWTHDELKPVSQDFRDPFCGWAATLVDSLDTLWIMGMEDEFDQAVQAVKDIDFTTTPYRNDIPVFETVIRYLGGLLAAYDVSGGHSGNYRILLDKALELAEILMGAFDTPNRMPVLYYSWKPEYASQPQRASSSASVAELGSLSMEFTHLAQLTGKNKYYDAVARITDALEDYQNRGTALPGIFPERIDASGCNRTAAQLNSLAASSKGARAQAEAAEDISDPEGYTPDALPGDKAPKKQGDNKNKVEFHVTPGVNPGDPGIGEIHNIGKRDVDSTNEKRDTSPAFVYQPFTAAGSAATWECVPQGLTSGGSMESYSMGGSQDSTYEYFPKQYLLLGGLEPKYRTIHEKVVKAVKKYLLFKPLTKDDRDILFSAKANTRDNSDEDLIRNYEITHLTCFLGGMFGLGGKIFESPEDVEVGKRLAAGCAWAYETFPMGIMPEMSTITPCEDPSDCHWNETLWWDRLDPNPKWRDDQMRDYFERKREYEQELALFEKEAALRAKAEEEAKRQEALRKQSQQVDNDKREAGSVSDLAAAGPGGNGTVPSIQKRQVAVSAEAAERADRETQIEEKVRTLEAELDLNSVTAHQSHTGAGQAHAAEPQRPEEPAKPVSHAEFVKNRIANEHLPPGFTTLNDRRYILRPEAIESVWYMYRITGDPLWQERGWRMFESVIAATQTPIGHSAVDDITIDPASEAPMLVDNMESFWLAETLKYFYLLFTTPDVISLDDWVLNTEAHPFRRPT
ncbi:putative glycoside hydrolase [Phialemonium atrogriseum]|uniref:alpha-1,2-Mannosidase n=1 Tax=Phialemonium atrogriseum TaxID=1093897 RepID=A0AAJ0BY73_9PEZI|nr:putative glycoside hydrolase [Phialemonium atrogriseum]KAK1766456.1 putative glycoside hydrolase [Phialemonium atrogriseum]